MLTTYAAFQREAHDRMVRPFPGAGSVVSEIRERGSAVGIVTSKSRGIAERTLRACALEGRLDFVVCGDVVERGTPDPEPERDVFVGDSVHDLRSGRAAGVSTAAVGWGPIDRGLLEAERPDYFLRRMEEVLEIEPLR